jgi:ribosomal protein S18 acetylase RimI-like enzyme
MKIRIQTCSEEHVETLQKISYETYVENFKGMKTFALEKSAELQKRYAWLGVWERNEKAIAFYEKLGLEKAGNHLFRMGDEIQSDYIMKKSLKS